MAIPLEWKRPAAGARFPVLWPAQIVFGWEIARLLRSRLAWLAVLTAPVLTALTMWRLQPAARLLNPMTYTSVPVDTNSPWGALLFLPSPIAFWLAALLPFIFTGQLSRELRQRTHELLMTTATPGWAFVAGRYLAGLAFSLTLALLVLLALLATGQALHLWAGQPSMAAGPLAGLWAVCLLPPIVVLSGLACALAAWWPRRTAIITALLLVAWFAAWLWLKLPPGPTPWYAAWEPTASLMPQVFDREHRDLYFSITRFELKDEVLQATVARVQQQMPDLGRWLPGQATWVALSLGLVALAARRFRRFADCLK